MHPQQTCAIGIKFNTEVVNKDINWLQALNLRCTSMRSLIVSLAMPTFFDAVGTMVSYFHATTTY